MRIVLLKLDVDLRILALIEVVLQIAAAIFAGGLGWSVQAIKASTAPSINKLPITSKTFSITARILKSTTSLVLLNHS